MSFLEIEIKPTAEKGKPSWMDQPNENTVPASKQIDQKTVAGSQSDAVDLMVFEYPEIEEADEYATFKIEKIDHKTPRHWKALMMSNRDFLNWFETICMATVMNARWNFSEFLVPTCLREAVGGSRVTAYTDQEPGRRDVITWKVLVSML